MSLDSSRLIHYTADLDKYHLRNKFKRFAFAAIRQSCLAGIIHKNYSRFIMKSIRLFKTQLIKFE